MGSIYKTKSLPRRGYRIQPRAKLSHVPEGSSPRSRRGMRIQPRVEWREDKENVGDLFCPGFAAKSRSNFKFSSLAKACLKV